MKLADWLKQLQRATRTLDHTQGRIARRNARQRVKQATRGLLRALDNEYPLIKLASDEHKHRARKTLVQRCRELVRDGWVIVQSTELLGLAAELHLPVRRTPSGMVEDRGKEKRWARATWIPGWVAHYAPNKSQLLLARKNATMIQAANAAIRLGSLEGKLKAGEIVCPTM